MASKHVLLLTGAPGVGKTTLLRQVAAALAERKVDGFTTEEMREAGQRVGFRIVPLHADGRVMAHARFRSALRVSHYGVDVDAVDAVAGTALELRADRDVYLVDEIGKMECFSGRFVTAMRALLDSDKRVVATIARAGAGFIAEVKRRDDVELWEVTRQNRHALVAAVLQWIG